jgi:ribonuclease Z
MIYAEVKNKIDEDISVLVTMDNHASAYLCDCGQASLLTVKDYNAIQAVFISHTHIDHFVHFDHLIRHQVGSGRRIVICGNESIGQKVQSKLQAYTWNLLEAGGAMNAIYEVREIISDDTIRIYELHAPEWQLTHVRTEQTKIVYQTDVFEVQFTILDHKTPCVAYLFVEPDKVKIDLTKSTFKAGKWVKQIKELYEQQQPEALVEVEGKTYKAGELFPLLDAVKGYRFGFIMDFLPNSENEAKITKLFFEADKIMIEAFYRHEEVDLALKNYHSTATLSAQIARKAQVKEAIPVHFSRRHHSTEAHQQLVEEFQQAFK